MSNSLWFGASPKAMWSHAVKSGICHAPSVALQRRPGSMEPKNTHLLIMATWANDHDFALRSQFILRTDHPQ